MNIFDFRDKLIHDYASYIDSFIKIKDGMIQDKVLNEVNSGLLYPEPFIQLNPFFQKGKDIDELIAEKILHPLCKKIFRAGKEDGFGEILKLYKHQTKAIYSAQKGENYVLTTGTGSGKSLSYIVPIVDFVLKNPEKNRIKAIIVYPMNALANSQESELDKFINLGFPDNKGPVTFAKYTGQESKEKREQILKNPPDILLTNYVMLELILTRIHERKLLESANGLRFLVFDELHTYRGRQGADVSMLIRRLRNQVSSSKLQCIGTSATMASGGSFQKQLEKVSEVSSLIFGSEVKIENIIGETLERITESVDIQSDEFILKLKGRLQVKEIVFSSDFEEFKNDPVTIWIEQTIGVEEKEGRLVRCKPHQILGDDGLAEKLSKITDINIETCKTAIMGALLAGYRCPNPNFFNKPSFAFKLHQFISKGKTVFASLECEDQRYITLNEQQFVPGSNRKKYLYPLLFCRECGKEFYAVKKIELNNELQFLPRDVISFKKTEDDIESVEGYLYIDTKDSLPDILGNGDLPEDWFELDNKGESRLIKARKKYVPQNYYLDGKGIQNSSGIKTHFFPQPVQFCPKCGVTYNATLRSDFTKLATLGTEGRSTATTILSLSTLKNLSGEKDISKKAQKLLSFTDNRQDASLQAGHFNDFIEMGILRSAIYKAVLEVGSEGITHDYLAKKVFDALSLPFEEYAQEPTLKYGARIQVEEAFRDVLGYRIYRDLKRGWRVTSPNLEQCGLLEIDYLSINDLCLDSSEWKDTHPALQEASMETRRKILKTLADYMRRELAINVDYLNKELQEVLVRRSNTSLYGAWAFDDGEKKLDYASIVFPRAKEKTKDNHDFRFLSSRGGFGRYLKRASTFSEYQNILKSKDINRIIKELFLKLRIAGIVDLVWGDEDDPGYQLSPKSMIWKAGDGIKGFHDPIRLPKETEEEENTNKFFKEFYKTTAFLLKGFEAREHTAQVPINKRIERENQFKNAELKLMFCSPTMELGVDIDQLNVVNMRNVPPTPANYAQRSGRAGRSGQPALIFTYCSTGNSHDQYFFRRPLDMITGSVKPPRIDLANRSLIESHIHAIWLTESGIYLGETLKEILSIDVDDEKLPLKDDIDEKICNKKVLDKTKEHILDILTGMEDLLEKCSWYSDKWLEETFSNIPEQFNHACDRWRVLYRNARKQQDLNHEKMKDPSKSEKEKRNAARLRNEAESQLDILLSRSNVIQSDFYSYRYFASEGFLPGYNFPRLPLSAFIPARGKTKKGEDEYLSRPRFLAIAEFGPRAILYHEGARYEINRVIMSPDDELNQRKAKICSYCGYLHPNTEQHVFDICEICDKPLDGKDELPNLFKLENVSTRKREKINSDEEERTRHGYEVKTVLRFTERGNYSPFILSDIYLDDKKIGEFIYGDSAILWRMNFGLRRRKDKNIKGFNLDKEKGYWEKNEIDLDKKRSDIDEPIGKAIQRVIPFVEDRRNALLFKPAKSLKLSVNQMATLQSALKNAIQVVYQLEDNELAAEPLPNFEERSIILFYESSEGGAGVLKEFVENQYVLKDVVDMALNICHFTIDGIDQQMAPGAREICEAACYDCLMNYGNQRDHVLFDRHVIKDFLMMLKDSVIKISPNSNTRSDHYQILRRLCDSDLEKEWLDLLEKTGKKLPSDSQRLIEEAQTKPDFIYTDNGNKVAIYIDGPHHDTPDQRMKDEEQREDLEDLGWTVLVFSYKDKHKWLNMFDEYQSYFGV